MNIKQQTITICFLVLSLLIPGCGLGQLFGPTPAPTATSTPPATATPTPGIGVLVVHEGWEVTVTGANTETELSDKPTIPFSSRTYTPNPGFIFLVVDVIFRKPEAQDDSFISTDVSLITEDGTEITAVGGGDATTFCAGCVTMFQVPVNQNISKSFVFVISEDDLGQVFGLQFKDVPPIPFSIK